MRIVVLYNEPVLPADHPDAESEREIVDTAEIVARYLTDAGFTVSLFGAGRDAPSALAGLTAQRPDAVFNFYEGAADDGETEPYMAALMEWLDIPFTGCPFQTL